MWTAGRALCFQVEDAGPPALPAQGRRAGDSGQPVPATGGGTWPPQPAHGLWLTRELADQMSVFSGPGGSRVTAVFTLRPR